MPKKLFTPAPHNEWQRNAVAGGHYSDMYAYILGYYEAGTALVRAALDGPAPHTQDLLFFPACFCYRHYVELSLKHLLLATEKYHTALDQLGLAKAQPPESVENKLTRQHSLHRLLSWLEVRLVLVADGILLDDNVRSAIMQLHAMDVDGQAFRYPVRSDRRTLSIPTQGTYDLEAIRTQMEEVQLYLSGLDAWLDYNTSQAVEVWEQMRQDAMDNEMDTYGHLL